METGMRCFFILAFPKAKVVGAAALRGKTPEPPPRGARVKLHPHRLWMQLLLLPFYVVGSWRSLGVLSSFNLLNKGNEGEKSTSVLSIRAHSTGVLAHADMSW